MTVLSCSCSLVVYTYRYTRREDWSCCWSAPCQSHLSIVSFNWRCQSVNHSFHFFTVALSLSLGTDEIWRKLSFTCLLCQPLPDRLFSQVSLTHLYYPSHRFLIYFRTFSLFSIYRATCVVVRCFGAQYSPRRLPSICSWQPQDSTVLLCPVLHNLLSISIVMQQLHEAIQRCWSLLRDQC